VDDVSEQRFGDGRVGVVDKVRISPVERLAELGGIATRGTLLRTCDRRDLDRAVSAGDIVRVVRGRYALAIVDQGRQAAARVGGVLGLTSAALHHGWEVKTVPARPQVMVTRGRRVDAKRDVEVHRAELATDDVHDGVTIPAVTLAHCMRRLPFDEALAIADSALRAGVPRAVLARIADEAKGPGSPQMRRVAACATSKSANPFESVLHAIALDVPGLSVEPQVTIREPTIVARPDLVDQALRIVLEADSYEWHGGRAQLSADARRYNLLVVNGWLVLRFSYEHVMTQPDFVRRVLVAAVELAQLMREVGLLAALAA
jgi:very-short-patch-repair endonuclease